MGMYVKELGNNRFLFQMAHEIDISRVIDGSPWSFNRAPLIFKRLTPGENPMESKLNHMDIWVQIHELQNGFRSERVVKDIGNYVGAFIKSDPNNFVGVWREYLRVRVTIDIDLPLKRKMKIKKKGGEWFWVTFKYEHVPTFCFICGVIGHSERFCPNLFKQEGELIERPYGAWMRAITKRATQNLGSKWLRSEPMVIRQSDNTNNGGARVGIVQRNDAVNQEKDKGTVSMNGEKSGLMDVDESSGNSNSNITDNLAPGGKGMASGITAGGVENGVGPDGGIEVIDPKRRRTEEEFNGLGYNVIMGFNQDGLSKNGQEAGSGLQARQQL